MSEVTLFSSRDIENIISWFERIHSSGEEISDYECETYLKLAKYYILDEKAMSYNQTKFFFYHGKDLIVRA